MQPAEESAQRIYIYGYKMLETSNQKLLAVKTVYISG